MTGARKVLVALAAWLAAWPAPGLALAAPPTWIVDKTASRLAFSGTVSGQGFTGVFRRWDAVIHFAPQDLVHSDVAVTIAMTSAVTGDGDRDALLPHGLRLVSPGHYEAPGVLTLRGVAHPLTLPFSLAITGKTAKMNAQAPLNRLALGVGQGEWTATDTVGAPVILTTQLTATRAP